MVTRFVAVSILTYQTRNVRLLVGCFACGGVDRVERSHKLLSAAENLLHALHIVRNEEAILPSGGFGVGMTHLKWVERSLPIAVGAFAAEKAGRAVEHIHILLRTLHIFVVNIDATYGASKLSNAPVVVGIFEQARHRFAFAVLRDKSVFHIVIEPFGASVGSGNHSLEGVVGIEVANAFEISLGEHSHRVIANHAARFARRKRPDGQFLVALVAVEHRIIDISHQVVVDKRHERMPGAESVPKR